MKPIFVIFLTFFIQLPISAACKFPFFYTTADDLEIKMEPKDDSAITKTISRLKFGKCIEKRKQAASEEKKVFYHVQYDDTTEGWIDSNKIFFIEEKPGSQQFIFKKAEITVSNGI